MSMRQGVRGRVLAVLLKSGVDKAEYGVTRIRRSKGATTEEGNHGWTELVVEEICTIRRNLACWV